MSTVEPSVIQKIIELADYSAIKKLAAALWQQDVSYHGAAIMVGAGFSRSAAHSGDTSKKLSLWLDFSKKIAGELDPTNERLPLSDPLRLAEEYRAYFGQQTLNDLIKKEINDAAWTPGDLYKSLLSLPWSEVLTTNWDTLLERASQEINHPIYNIVSKQTDLSSVRAPRIVKLHGTINATEELVFCQEDYRKYPQTHAAFVNFARQVFIENELCLLGFSGDDPNFLQWAGWVRDHLTKHSRRIYLIGALNLTAAKRKYLESINISPVDLWSLVTEFDDYDVKHTKSTEFFFAALNHLKPKKLSDWRPSDLSSIESLEEKIFALKYDRESYPGWLICPHTIRWQVSNQISLYHFSKDNISKLSPDNRALLSYELAWRYNITFDVVPLWLSEIFINICDPATPCILGKKKQMEIALLLLKNTRWFDKTPETQSVTKITTDILEKNFSHWPDSTAELAYHQAILAAENFNYREVETLVEKIVGVDPIWKIKKSSILGELGLFSEGEALVSKAYHELLDQYRRDRNSIHVLSRLSWAHVLLRGMQGWTSDKELDALPASHKGWKCDPYEQVDHIKEKASKGLEDYNKKQTPIEPLFEPGHYRDNSNNVSLSNDTHLLLMIDGISQNTGLPLHWNNTNFLKDAAEKIIATDLLSNSERFKLSIRASTSDTSISIKNTFSRINLACTSQEEILLYLNHCDYSINFWRAKISDGSQTHRNHCIERLRVFIEVYARLLTRATPEMAEHAFKLALEIGKEQFSNHLWLKDPINNLLKYSLKSIPKSQHSKLLLEALRFPLPSEKNNSEWPNITINHPGLREPSVGVDSRIAELIQTIVPSSSSNSDITASLDNIEHQKEHSPRPKINSAALSRLLPLVINKFTTPQENFELSKVLYGEDFDFKTLPNSIFLPHIFSILPSNDETKIVELVSRELFPEHCPITSTHLQSIIAAAHCKQRSTTPTPQQSTIYFDQLTSWRSDKKNKHPFDFTEQTDKQIGRLIGEALGYSIIPSMPEQDLTKERFDQLFSFWSNVDSPSTAIAFVYFTKSKENFSQSIEKIIRKGLQERQQDKVSCAAFALLKWRELSDTEPSQRLIKRLLYLIESGRTTGLTSLLWTINEIHNKKWLSKDGQALLVDVIPYIFDDAHYSRIARNSRDAVSTSFVRAACVKLARDIIAASELEHVELLRVLNEAKQDALPEVRFAGDNEVAD